MDQFLLNFEPKQTNFELLHGNTINNIITMKIRPLKK